MFFARPIGKASYAHEKEMVREAGLEPATSRLSAGCSNRLSHPRKGKPATYNPVIRMTVVLKSLFVEIRIVNCNVRRQLQDTIECSRENNLVEALTCSSERREWNSDFSLNSILLLSV